MEKKVREGLEEKKGMSGTKKSCLGCGGLVILLIIIAIASAGKKDSNSQTVSNPSSNSTTTSNTAATPSTTAQTAKTETLTITNSSAKHTSGFWEVVGEVKNNDSIKHSAILKATFYASDGSIKGTASGAVNDITAGDTKTFNLMSGDDVTGYKDMKVQVDTLL